MLTVDISFYIKCFMDFLKERYAYFRFTDHETEHQRGKIICLKFSSSSLVEQESGLGQFDPFLYASLPSLEPDLKGGCFLIVR